MIGMISGSAAANVAVTGSVTIPMMKKSGFRNSMAGGIEAAASTGGHIMPPIMSGVVFVMADILGIRYWSIVAIAFLPAILYFLGIMIQVHAYSVKHDLRVTADEFVKLPKLSETLKKGWQHLLPLAAIIGLLAYGFSTIRAALYSMPIVIVVSWFQPETRMGFKHIIQAFVTAIKMIRVVMLATGLAGILMGFLFITGAGSNFVSIIQNISGDTLMVSLIIAAVFCIFLGLTLSGLASYLLTAILIAPAAVSMGVPEISIHFFALYYASVALITPPVGPVSFQAAALADAGPYQT